MDFSRLKRMVDDTLTQPGEQLGRWARFVRFQFELWRFCARRLRENNLLAMSAALSFRTIFALIPALVLAFLMLKSIGFVEDGKRALRDFLTTSGFAQIVAVQENPRDVSAAPSSVEDGTAPAPVEVPVRPAAPDAAVEDAAGTVAEPAVINVAELIEGLVVETESKLTFQRIGPVGAALLIWTAITLLTTLEGSLNRIFEAPRSRAMARRVLLYWSALTLGPVLIVLVKYYSGRVEDAAAGLPGITWLAQVFGWLAPIVVGIVVVAGGYRLIPNTHVRMASAFGGALVSVPLWLVAKWGFRLYVDHFVLKGNLYGVLGVLPLFMLWLNVSWTVFLFGAQLAYTATNLKELRQAELADRIQLGPSDLAIVAAAVCAPFSTGDGPASRRDVVRLSGLPADAVQQLLDQLTAAGVISVTGSEQSARYLPSRSPEKIGLAEIVDLGDPRAARATGAGTPLASSVAAMQSETRAALRDTSLADLLAAARQSGEAGSTGRPPTPTAATSRRS